MRILAWHLRELIVALPDFHREGRNQPQIRHTSNPNLQIYHGVSQVVQEFAGSLLSDSTRRVRKELTKLWRKYRRSHVPEFVYVINYDALMFD